MVLNIFFDNMNGTLELVLIGTFIVLFYLFVLRRFNSLGFRMLFLCTLLFAASCTWLYKDEMSLKHTIGKGEEYVATIVSKSIIGSKKDNQVEITFTNRDGKVVNTNTSKYISEKEWQGFETGKPLSVIYVPDSKETFVQQSIMRFKEDKIYLYFFAGFWLVLGLVLYFWLRKYKVGVDDRGNEWLERKDGTVFFDERKSAAYRMAKRGNILSKLAQAFSK